MPAAPFSAQASPRQADRTSAQAGGAPGAAQAAGIEPPALVAGALPEYPQTANGESGSFELGLTLDRSGTVVDAQVLSRAPEGAAAELEAAALAAARQLRFSPARRNGEPIAARITYRMRVAPPALGEVEALPPTAAGGAARPRAARPAGAASGGQGASAVAQGGVGGPLTGNAAAARTGPSGAAAGADGRVSGSPGDAAAATSGVSGSPDTAAARGGGSGGPGDVAADRGGESDAAAAVSGGRRAGDDTDVQGGAAGTTAVDGGEPRPAADGGAPEYGATGHSRTLQPPPARAASDFFLQVGHLRDVPRGNASDLLRLAPGISLTNEGGEGHAERVYLRGFDAREGQDLELTVDGVPINDVGNPHGEGYADTHFILPELVRAVRVLEGPFDPHQGNYAVAGSAEYVLGLERRGIAATAQLGSFDTQRLLLTWAPEQQRTGTFVGADVRRSAGFGQNRAAELARALGQYELDLGKSRLLRVLATSYATRYGSAGVVREDDYDAGAIDFYGSYDPTQGGDAQRHGFALTFEERHPEWALRQQVFATLRELRLRENFTGFLEDPPEPFRSGSAQRGDMVDQSMSAVTVGARGSLRQTRELLGRPQSLELGYYARHDGVDSAQRRLRWKTVVPYRVDFDYTHAVTNVGLYADLELRPLPFVSLRGGLRSDLFLYDTLDRCALHDTVLNSATPVLDELCYVRDRVGPRDPSSRRSASGLAWQPRGTLIIGPFADLSLVAALGSGARAVDPSYLGDGDRAPFSRILAAEGGVTWSRELGSIALNLRGLYYSTHVGQDLIFNQQEGRNTLAPGTRRQGMLVAGRVQGSFFDVSASGTYAHARFEEDELPSASAYRPADAGTRVPYIPSWVARVDAAFFRQLPGLRIWGEPLAARASLGASYTSPRALTYGEQGQATFLADVAVGAALGAFELGVSVQNLFDARYRLAEYNYVSEFRQDAAAPNLLPVRHFTAGAPRSVLVTLTVHLGGKPAEGS